MEKIIVTAQGIGLLIVVGSVFYYLLISLLYLIRKRPKPRTKDLWYCILGILFGLSFFLGPDVFEVLSILK